MGIRTEQAVHQANLESYEQTEGNADQTGSNGEPAIERLEMVAGVGKRSADNHRDQHHSGSRSNSENDKVQNGPAWISNRGQHQQRNGRRSGQSMHDAHG